MRVNVSTSNRKLLIIACSNRKVCTKGLVPAIERYDGVNYRVIHKLQREGCFPASVDVKILSAKFGLIDASTPIPYYDQMMDRKRAEELHGQVLRDLKNLFVSNHYDEVLVNAGKVYFSAMAGLRDIAGKGVRVKTAEGGIGSKMKAMKDWLFNLHLERSRG